MKEYSQSALLVFIERRWPCSRARRISTTNTVEGCGFHLESSSGVAYFAPVDGTIEVYAE